MKILCFIDSLNSGGAQRQLVMLAKLLKQTGYDVAVLCYYHIDFFQHVLDDANIPVIYVKPNKILRIPRIAKEIKSFSPRVVISFLDTPNIIVEIIKKCGGRFKLIVSDRSIDQQPQSLQNKFKYKMYEAANVIVPNSYTQGNVLRSNAQNLINKLQVIPNCVDTNKFKPLDGYKVKDNLTMLVVASFNRCKNPINFVKALSLIRENLKDKKLKVEWFGKNFYIADRPTEESKVYLETRRLICELTLNDIVTLNEPVKDINLKYQECDVFCLPSFYEGCPNVICEAMACGKPILTSNVCDNSRYVEDGNNGFLFDPNRPQSIADAIMKFLSLDDEHKQKMSINNVSVAERYFSENHFVRRYIELIESI